MSAIRLQNELKDVFDAPALAVVGADSPSNLPTIQEAASAPREIDEILANLGRLSAEASAKIKEHAQRSGDSFAISARKLKLVSAADLCAATAIRDGVLRAEPAAFALHADLVTLRRPQSAAAEQYGALRTRLMTTQAPDKLKLFSVIPSGPGVRANAAAANLAVAFAQIGKHVLLVDANVRRPSAATLFGVPDGGLVEHLSGARDFDAAVQQTPIERLKLLAAHGPAERPQELLAGAPFRAALERARAEFDVVVVLTAPFGPAADGQFVWAETRSGLIVVRRDDTRAEDLKQLQVVLRQIGTEILGAVVTA
ncbi:MAG: CpsD/CapB family tyrosine-protein kinase [Parvularculaceae bacterium]